jgi:putative transposase
VFGQYALHKECYHPVKAESGLAAQVVVRLIAKVADAYKLDREWQRTFRPIGSIAYNARILRYYAASVSIWTVQGRQSIPFVCGERQQKLLTCLQGESDLVYREGDFYLHATVNYIEPPEGECLDAIGVDVGIVNIATDSDGNRHSGALVCSLRHRHRRLRAKLSRKFTASARRLYRKRRRKEERFARNINHRISKQLVAEAQCTKRALVLEDLNRIRSRIKARKPQRATLSSWSFAQLRGYIEYKARMAGVWVIFVDPRNTSRTCPYCGHCEKANRQSQERFLCRQCGLAGLADHIAALNLRAIGRVSLSMPDADAVGSAKSLPFRGGVA